MAFKYEVIFKIHNPHYSKQFIIHGVRTRSYKFQPSRNDRKQNNFYITCLYLREYKKGFAFLTKFQ